MLTPASTSQPRIRCNDPVVVLNVRVSLRRPREPVVRTHTVTEPLPTSSPATRSNMTSIASLLPAREATLVSPRRSGGTSARTQTRVLSRQQSSGNRDPRAIHLSGIARTRVSRRRRPTPHSHQPVQRLEERNRLHLVH